MAAITITVTPKALPVPLPNFLLGNWRTQIQMDTSYITDVTNADTAAEARRGLLLRPRRTLRVTMSGMNRDQSAQIQQDLLRHANDIMPIPLFQDQTLLTGDTESATDKIPMDTSHGRWFVGARIVIFKGEDNSSVSAVQYFTIAVIDPAFIEVNEALGDAEYVAGDTIMPCIDAQIHVEAQRFKQFTDFHGEVGFKAVEATGVSALPRLTTTIPPEFQLFTVGVGGDDRAIFDIPVNYANAVAGSIKRDGNKFSSGRGVIVFTKGDRARFAFEFSILSTQDEAFQFLKFFDYAQGRLQQFWFANHLTQFEVTDITGVKIKPNGRIENLRDFMEFFFMDQGPGKLRIGIVSSVIVDGPDWKILFSNATGISAFDPEIRSTTAHKVRFSNDRITEKWTTDELMGIQLRFKEVLEEKEVTVANI